MSSYKLNDWNELRKASRDFERNSQLASKAMEVSWESIIETHRKDNEQIKATLDHLISEIEKTDNSIISPQRKYARIERLKMKVKEIKESLNHLVSQRKSSYDSDSTPLSVFLDSINEGLYPTPELMFWISHCFSIYLKNGGEVSLEEVFFGRGNYSLRKHKELKYKVFHAFLALKGNDSNLQVAERTYKFLDDHFKDVDKPEDIESFLRGYRRWKNEADK